MIKRLSSTLVAAASLSACAEPLPPRGSGAAAELQRLSVYVDPQAKVTSTTDRVPARWSAKLAATIPAAVAQELAEAGFSVAVGPSEKHDATVHLRVQIQGEHEAVIWAVAERDDVEIATVGYANSYVGFPELPAHAGIELVKALIGQPELGDFVRGPADYVAARRPRSQPPPPPKVAAVASAPPPVAPPPPATDLAFVAAAPQPTAFALVIGIEKYRDVPAPAGARADAERFRRVLKETFGVPPDQILEAFDAHASKSDIEKSLNALAKRVRAGDRVYFFFSGHGAPDPASGASYLVPYDGDPAALDESALQLSDVLDRLSKTKAKEVIAFVDSCFSGSGGRSVLPAGARPLVKLKEVAPPASSVTLFSAATGAEISGPDEAGTGGVFSDYLVEGLATGEADLDGDGQISLKELGEWVKPRVAREAQKSGRTQTPTVAGGDIEHLIVGWGYRRSR